MLRSQNEHWYDIHVWGPLIDKMFMDVDCLDVIRHVQSSLPNFETLLQNQSLSSDELFYIVEEKAVLLEAPNEKEKIA